MRTISANVRGFHSNVGEINHQFANKQKADIVLTAGTFPDVTMHVYQGIVISVPNGIELILFRLVNNKQRGILLVVATGRHHKGRYF